MRAKPLGSVASAGQVAGATASPGARWSLRRFRSRSHSRRGVSLAGSPGLHRPLQIDRIRDRAPGGGAGAARLAGAAADGDADRSIRRTPRLHGAPRVLVARRIRPAADPQLRLTPGGRVSHRDGRIVLRGRRRVRVPLDPGGPPGHGPRRLRAGDDGAIAGGLRRAGGRGPPGLGGGISRHRRGSWPGRSPTSCWRGIPRTPHVPPPSPRWPRCCGARPPRGCSAPSIS